MRRKISTAACVLLLMLGSQVCGATVTQTTKGLPDDSQFKHVSLIVHDDWQQRPPEVALAIEWARCKKENPRVHWHFYTRSNPIFRANLGHRVRMFPVIILQEADGVIVDSKTDIAVGGKCQGWFPLKLWLKIRRLRRAGCGPCTPNTPVVPETTTTPPPVDSIIVDVQPQVIEPTEPTNTVNEFIVFLCGVGALFAFFALQKGE